MNKLFTGLLTASMIVAAGSSYANGTPAPEAAGEGVEISGAVDVVGGWHHDDQDASVGGNLGGFADYGVTRAADADHVRFLVNQVELDLAKSFGENIRLRADIDFRDIANTGAGVVDTLDLEQAYVTANLAVGNGIEFLVGKFNAPVGVESVDTRDNWFVSYAPPFRYMTPTNVTGVKLYYAFNDNWDLHIGAVNDLNSNGFGDSALPSGLFRVGYNWGDEGNKSTIGISGGVGPESDSAVAGGASNNAHWDFFGDLDAMVALSDTWSVALEGVYRQSDALVAGANQKAIAGFLAAKYQASDVWDVAARFGYLYEINPPNARGGSGASTTGSTWSGSTNDGQIYSGTLGAGYSIADGAKLKLEYRYDWFNNSGTSAATDNDDAQSVLAQFAYSF